MTLEIIIKAIFLKMYFQMSLKYHKHLTTDKHTPELPD